MYEVKDSISYYDSLLKALNTDIKKELQPDLLITFGSTITSKSLKEFLRNYRPLEHWHVQEKCEITDTFKTLSKVIECTINYFLDTVLSRLPHGDYYKNLWLKYNSIVDEFQCSFFNTKSFNEIEVVRDIIKNIPDHSNLHLSNSMPVRYANYFSCHLYGKKNVSIWCNRGTSGIEGSNSSAMGCSLSSSLPCILITGDMSFFYDRNAFWHNYSFNNLKIVVINNHGGGIFKILTDSKLLPENDEYFFTSQSYEAKWMAFENKILYYRITSRIEWNAILPEFFNVRRPIVVEVISNIDTTSEIFDSYNDILVKHIETSNKM